MKEFFRYTRHILAILITVSSFGFLYVLALKAMPPDNKDVLLLAAVAGYYYGSSKDKSDQDKVTNQKP